jgi:hypothetical protein
MEHGAQRRVFLWEGFDFRIIWASLAKFLLEKGSNIYYVLGEWSLHAAPYP